MNNFPKSVSYILSPMEIIQNQQGELLMQTSPAMQEIPNLGQEDSLEKEMATHFSILAWEIP